MSVDFTRFPFPGMENPHAATLTEAIRSGPVSNGYVIVTCKVEGVGGYVETIRRFAGALRMAADQTGFSEIYAFREIRRDELGGAIPFDHAICESIVGDAERRQLTESDHYPTIKPALKMARENDVADWLLMIELATHDQALALVSAWKNGDAAFGALVEGARSHTVGAFETMMRYGPVSRDPNLIQFFNLFPGPGETEALWAGWQEALPWFFEEGEFRSSFPLAALDNGQPLLIVNYAHCDSIKHFILGVLFNPRYLETVTRAYKDRGFKLPMPFFCKVVPV